MTKKRYWIATIALLTGAISVGAQAHAEPFSLQGKAEVYQTPEGQDYAAISLKLNPEVSASLPPEQVLVLIDTSASQVGEFRLQTLRMTEQLLKQLPEQTQVAVWAVDLQQTPLTEGYVTLNAEQRSKIQSQLKNRLPAGSTDLCSALENGLQSLNAERSAAILYLGDGFSAANLISNDKMQELITLLKGRQVPVTSYAIGSQTDLQLLGILALRSGGTVLRDLDATSPEAAAQNLFSTLTAQIWYPQSLQVSDSVQLLPNTALPIRSDRETIYLSKSADSVKSVQIALSGNGESVQTEVGLGKAAEGHTALRAMWLRSAQDQGLSVSTAGQAVLSTAKDLFERQVATMMTEANTAANQGNNAQTVKISQAVLQLDPKNVAASRLAQLQTVSMLQDGQENAPPPIVSELDELEAPAAPSLEAPSPLEQDMIQRYQNRSRVAGERLSLQVSQAIEQARGITNDDPNAALTLLKNVQGTIRSAADIDPEIRQELERRVGNVILEVRARREQIQNQRVRFEQQLAESEARERVIEGMLLEEERLQQLIDQVRALLDDGFHGNVAAYAQAQQVAEAAVQLVPFSGPANSARFLAQSAARLEDARYLRWLRQDRFLETLTSVEFAHVPFPDEPPIRWPSAPVWKALTERRRIWASVDLKDDTPSERRIRLALDEETDLQFVDTPLGDALDIIGELHNITILTDDIALEDAGISTDEPVSLFISGVRLRSALKIMLEKMPEPLTWVIEDEVMKITTVTVADEIVESRVYPVADLVIPIQPIGGSSLGGGLGGGMGGMGGGMGGMGGMGGGFGGGGQGGGFFSIPAEDVSPAGKKKS